MAFMLATAGAQAHHAFSTEFDVNRQVTLQGKVVKVELINPHSWLHVEVMQDGKPVVWMVEGGSPNALVRRGITKNSIPIGSELVIRGYGTRDGSNKAVGREMTFAEGKKLAEIPADQPNTAMAWGAQFANKILVHCP